MASYIKKAKLFLLILLTSANVCIPVRSQEISNDYKADRSFIDSLAKAGILRDTVVRRKDVTLSREEAVKFLQENIKQHRWKDINDPLRTALGQLVSEATHKPFDSTEYFLKAYPYDSLSIPWDRFFIWEPVRVKMQGRSAGPDSLQNKPLPDTVRPDTSAIKPEIKVPGQEKAYKDTTVMVVVDTLKEVTSDSGFFPYRYYRYPFQSDSLKAAVKTLMDFLDSRDSSIINIEGISGRKVPLWLNSRSDMMIRYWLKNDLNDSVTVWIGTPGKNSIGLYLENGVGFKRPSRESKISKARLEVQEINRDKLLGIHKIVTKTQYWKYRTESVFSLSQGYLSNWVSGGESSISTSLDLSAFADYNNSHALVSSNNFIRFRYGLIASATDGLMKNLDQLETNSKINHKAFGRFDFSTILLFKTQVSKGYKYPNDSVPVSKFLNPTMITLGFGLDYKPNKTTSINFSPLSYKLTIVHDTAMIDQTLYGIAKNRRALHEPGASLLITNEFKPFKNLGINNRLQLFTNYIHNPQNVDVDWEMSLTASINWFTEMRLNTHLIFDDDTKTPLYDKEKKPVLGPDGLQKKTARVQFKELLGLSFVFRF